MAHRRTIILDWDGTLAAIIPDGIITRPVHAARSLEINLVSIPLDREGKPGKYLLILRPHLYELILTLSSSYNLALWSYGVQEYILRCVNSTGLHTVFNGPNLITREDMQDLNTEYKDIYLIKNRLDIRMHETLIVDDSNASFGVLNPYNCLDIPSWTPDMRQDTCLKSLPALIEQRFDVLERLGEAELERRREIILRSLQ
jgi:TFIIF-interacting CTD phosphatase-like protein